MRCTTDKYEDLYARWLEKPAKLLDWASGPPIRGPVLDLCGGTGAVAKLTSDLEMETYLLDLNPRCDDPCVTQVKGRAETANFNPQLKGVPFQTVICRQALGYLMLDSVSDAVYDLLEPGGSFLFNNFAKPRWKASTYKHGGSRFAEASAYVGRHVFHVQLGIGIGIDVTHFRWHSHDYVMSTFESKFDVRYENRGRSYRYQCVK